MKALKRWLLVSAMLIYISCNPKITTHISKTYPVLDYKQDVLVIGLNESQPDSAEILGLVKIGDTGFSTNCSYEVVMDKAKLEARKAGGNAIKIIEYTPPTAMGSSCHRITAKILKIENIDKLIPKEEPDKLSDTEYAVLNIYRYSGYGSLVSYDLLLGDSVLCKVKNNFKTTLHIKKEGLLTLSARTETKSEIPIDLKWGKTYYLRCGIQMGAFVGRPSMILVDSKTGKSEFESFKAKNQ